MNTKQDHNNIEVITLDNMHIARELFLEYQNYLGEDLCFQNFEAELTNLPGNYVLPKGDILLATVNSEIAGMVARRPLSDTRCEMKRLYVRSRYRGLGLGRRLAEQCISDSRNAGFEFIMLDTLLRLTEAVSLYKSMGFVPCGPYTNNPLHGVSYWELCLHNQTA